MFPGYKRNILNIHGAKALLRSPLIPAENLAIGGDDTMTSIPLKIFCYAQPPMPAPTYDKVTNYEYHDLADKGKGDFVTLDNFVTDDFDISDAIRGY